MRVISDVNFLLAFWFEGHEHHTRARDWWAGCPSGTEIQVCRVVQLSFLRLSTNPNVMLHQVRTCDGAWSMNDRMLSEPGFMLVAEPDSLESEFRKLTKGFRFSPNLWQDAYLAAFAIAEKLPLVTFDKGFAKFTGLELILL